MRKIKILLLTLSLQSLLFAGGGSVYTRYGLGEFKYSFSARRFGMGELGYSVADRDFVSSLNPASWTKISFTRFETGLSVDASTQNSASSKSVFNSYASFKGLIFGFPISRDNGIAFVSGIVPYTNVSYQVLSSEVSDLVPEHQVTYTGEGGISKLFFGSSYNLPFGFSLGLSFDYYNGRINNNTEIVFGDSTTYHDATFKRQFNYHGIGMTAGLISGDISKLFGASDFKEFRVGFSLSPQVSLSADSSSTYVSLIGTYDNVTGSIKSTLPMRLGIGASFQITDNYLFSLDFMHQPMSKFDLGGVKSNVLQDISKFSFGFEYQPTARYNSFWGLVMLRAGLSYENTPYKFNGESINQTSVYAGCSLPLSWENTLDIGFQYGIRGTTNKNLLQEKVYKFNFSLSIGELWFIQTER